jgi:hypothetical protein
MDLFDLTPKSDTIVVTLLHPNTDEVLTNEDDSPMTVELYAPHSKEYKAAMHEQTNKQLKKTKGGRKEIEVRAEELEKAGLDLLVKVTKSWNITYKGEKPGLDRVEEVYETVFWIKDQIEQGLSETLDFTKK